jgi:ubiquinol-cytochrome c reductase cytochrome c1 subunit
MRALRFFIPFALAVFIALPAAADDSATPSPPSQSWSFNGLTGRIDTEAARRGFQVFSESCGACHSLTYLHYRDLSGIGFTDDQIKVIAAKAMVPTGIDAQGRPVLKRATPASWFRAPFPTEEAARATFNGALPPDLSLAVNSFPDGANYIAALLNGYRDPPAGAKLPDGMSYNQYYAGHFLAMPQPLSDGQIVYSDGMQSTVAQNAHDVVTFLYWAANPETNTRKGMGLRVVIYFLGMAGIAYGFQRRIWSRVQE